MKGRREIHSLSMSSERERGKEEGRERERERERERGRKRGSERFMSLLQPVRGEFCSAHPASQLAECTLTSNNTTNVNAIIKKGYSTPHTTVANGDITRQQNAVF